MRKPRYMEELLKIVFFWLGVSFVAAGLLSLAGVLRPSANSMAQEPMELGAVFLLLGVAFFLAQIVLSRIASLKNQLRKELLDSGIKTNGTVEKVYLQRYVQYGSQSPYRILYTYTSQGRTYHHKSGLLWDKPDLMEQDSIVVYANSQGKSTIPL